MAYVRQECHMFLRDQLLFFCFMFEMGRELCSKLWKMIFLNIFTWLGSFPYVFGTVKEWLTLELHEMITVTHVLAFPLDFNLLCD